ncbi:MAG: EAL domain-containing protein [Symbiobacteriaceae bacterium]|nr:EAL domain-containing protein [Symbiobacteriaceae bacterium]
MDIMLARQPIFNRKLEVVAYELLYRNYRSGGPQDRAVVSDGNQATSSVIIDALTNMGLQTVTAGRPAYINFTEDMILGDYATIFPPETIVIEILEDVTPSEALVQRCVELRQAGYTLALDDFVFTQRHLPLIQQANIIKMDFMQTEPEQLESLVKSFAPRGIKFLAEKVETREEMQKALAWGYEYFQGYFFSKPTVLRSSELAPMRLNLMRLMSETTKTDFEFADMSRVVMQDMGLMVKFLRLLNYVIPNVRKGGIGTIRQGMVLMGINSFRKWLYLMAMKDFAEDLPDELTRKALISARFCELLAPRFSYNSDECFIVGLFSLGETIMNMSMYDILKDLAVSEQVKEALLYDDGPLAQVLDLSERYINGDWDDLEEYLSELGNRIKIEDLTRLYYIAVQWCDELQEEMNKVMQE